MTLEGRRVLLRSALGTHSGYGRDGIHMVQEFLDQGVEVHIEPTSATVPLPPQVAALFAVRRPKRFDLMLHHCDPASLASREAMREVSDRVVAWTMWEFTTVVGEEWEPTFKRRMENYTDVLAYDSMTFEALAPYVPDHSMHLLQGGYRAKDWEPTGSRDWGGTFRYCMVGMLNGRKNPFATIYAFQRLKEKHGNAFDAELHLKTLDRSLHPSIEQWVPGIHIHYQPWSHQQMRDFYDRMHCYVAPSWGEGKNLPAIEAATTGCAVIVSECGGHQMWFDSSIGWMTRESTWAEHDPGERPTQESLRVDIDELAELMWFAYNNRGVAQQKGLAGSQLLPAQLDWSNVVKRLGTVLGL